MNIKRVKQGARITYYNGLYTIILGIFYIIFVRYNMRANFKIIHEVWGFFSHHNPEITSLFFLFNVLIGLFLISTGITTMYLSDFIWKRKEKITWVILFISGIISWGGLLTISILFKNWYLIILSFIGWLTFIIGMILPIKYYLKKNFREY